ncbi:S-adenosyl-L-methionine-dependent methyltransferase [Ilyonectria destructans]|nr:S-adenosyl-L-methionine-dependent methyltransferase [Ilyonectria destructans]
MAEEIAQQRGQDPQTPATQLQGLLAENPLQVDNGRRYHAFRAGSYLVPNDDEEQDRMDLVHHIYSLVLAGKLYLAPIGDNLQRVLDLGTGTVDDFESEWLYRKPFDFIHARELEGCIANDDQLFQQAFQHLVPGGYIELQACYGRFMSDDDTAERAANTQFWIKTICKGAAKFGKPLDNAPQWKEQLKGAGFVDIQQEIHKIPIGEWPKDPKLKEIGRYQSVQELKFVDSYTPGVFGRILGWSEEEIQVFMAKVKNDLKDPSIHLYLPVYFIWGRKP